MTEVSNTQSMASPVSKDATVKEDTTSNFTAATAPHKKYGDATELNLSPAAQNVISGKPSSLSSTTTATTSKPLATAPSAAEIIRAATQKVVPLVGLSGANEVVDNKGNISKSALSAEISEQSSRD